MQNDLYNLMFTQNLSISVTQNLMFKCENFCQFMVVCQLEIEGSLAKNELNCLIFYKVGE